LSPPRARLLVFSSEDPATGYGSATALRLFLAAAAQHTDWEVVTVVPAGRGTSGHDYDEDVVRLACGRGRITQLIVFPLRATVIALGRAARGADVIFSWQPLPTALAGWIAARRHGRPHVVRTCGPELHSRWSRFPVLSILARPLTTRLLTSADAVVVKCRLELWLLPRRVRRTRVHLVPNAVARPTAARPSPAEPQAKAKPRLLAVAQLEAHKGIDRLIDAVAVAAQEHEGGLRLTVVGDGSRRARLQLLARQTGADVAFAGKVPADRMAAVYSRHDALVVASVMEGCSNACLEALASGLPVIGPRLALDGLVYDGRNGILAAQADTADMTTAIHRFVHLRERWGAMQEAARAVAEQHRTGDLIDAYGLLLSTLTAAGPG
jgi:glycosyltransferase involved in cell wall biosynthesis